MQKVGGPRPARPNRLRRLWMRDYDVIIQSNFGFNFVWVSIYRGQNLRLILLVIVTTVTVLPLTRRHSKAYIIYDALNKIVVERQPVRHNILIISPPSLFFLCVSW